jgi:hypothetical protein
MLPAAWPDRRDDRGSAQGSHLPTRARDRDAVRSIDEAATRFIAGPVTLLYELVR